MIARKHLKSLLKLCWMCVQQFSRTVVALVQGNLSLAAEQARLLGMIIHDDLVQIVAALQKVSPFWYSGNTPVDRVLIVKLDRIGDMVNTTPVFDALRAVFPSARLDIVGHPTSLTLLEGDKRIAQRIAYRSWLYHNRPISPPGIHAWILVLRLLRQRYPVVVYLRGSFLFLLLGITSRLAAAKFVAGEPVVDRYLKPLESLWGPIPKHAPRLHISDHNLHVARQLLLERDPHEGPRIAIHAAAAVASKMWPVERFAAVADDLHRIFAGRVHFFGSPGDRTVLESISRHSVYAHSFHTNLSLPQVAAAISICDLFIGNDSGLSHAAAAVRTPVIVLWGPANLTMARPKAPTDRCLILYHDIPCRNACPEVRCVNPTELECLKKIQPSDVIDAARRFLNQYPPMIEDRRPTATL